MRINKNTTIVILNTTEWKLVLKPYGYNKLLLPIFGGLLGGSGGIIAGFFIGLFLDCELLVKNKPKKSSDNRLSYLMLGAFILQVGDLINKIPSSILQSRIEDKFGFDYATKRYAFFNELLRQRIQVEAICDQINAHATPKEKKDIIFFLFKFSNHPAANREKLHHSINYIAARFDLTTEDVKNVYNQFIAQQGQQKQQTTKSTYTAKTTDIYAAFNLTSNCTEKELKSAYYKLAKKYHPDSNPTATAAQKLVMQEKLRQIIEDYDAIKNGRGWK